MKRVLALYFDSWWLPAIVYLCLLGSFIFAVLQQGKPSAIAAIVLFCAACLAFLGLVAASIENLCKKRWEKGIANSLLVFGCSAATLYAFGFLFFASMFGPSEDGFADNLTIPEGIEIAEPDADTSDSIVPSTAKGTDDLQDIVRKALAVPGGDKVEFAPDMPSLRRVATAHAKMFRDYLEASPDWHVFLDDGNRFASRRWSYGGEPQDTLHGYISDFDGDSSFQTRCLLCLDRKQWGGYTVQHVPEGIKPITPEMSREIISTRAG